MPGMSRERYQRGRLEVVGKRTKQWKGHWYVYVTDEAGHEKRKHRAEIIGRKADLTRAQAQIELDRKIQEETSQAALKPAKLTLRQFVADVFLPVHRRRWAPNTVLCLGGCVEKHILSAFGDRALEEITKAEVEKHLIALADAGLKYQTVDRVLGLLRQVFEEAIDNGRLAANPARKAQPPRMGRKTDTRSLSEREVAILFAALEGRERLIVQTMTLCGLRKMECFGLRKDDLQGPVLRIDEQAFKGRTAPLKTAEYVPVRYAPLPPALHADLEALAGCIEDPRGLLFPAEDGGTIRKGTTEEMIERIRTQTGIADFTYQMCRTTFATLFRGDVKDVQEILGHTSVDMTLEHYKRAVPERQREAVAELETRLSGRVM